MPNGRPVEAMDGRRLQTLRAATDVICERGLSAPCWTGLMVQVALQDPSVMPETAREVAVSWAAAVLKW